MARTTATEVKVIMDNCVVSDDDITDSYILAANALVTEILGEDTTIGAVLLEQVECWLTAHLIASTRCRVTKREKIGDVSVEYTGTFKENLSSTPYGQMVLVLDPTGKMASTGKRQASIYTITSFD